MGTTTMTVDQKVQDLIDRKGLEQAIKDVTDFLWFLPDYKHLELADHERPAYWQEVLTKLKYKSYETNTTIL